MGRKDRGNGKESWTEDGEKYAKGWPKGGAGKAPKGRAKDFNPRGWGQSWLKGGPTRGTSSTWHDRKGGWFFGGGKK